MAGDARRALLSGLIDHAALFPPASMTMAEALATDRRARSSPAAFMLGRFVCPASKLGELGDEPRALSVVLDGPAVSDPRVESVEARRPQSLDALSGAAPEVYVELPPDDVLDDELAGLARLGLRAKVRCGGEQVPSVAGLARFVRGCRDTGVVFKATAGLHRAVRHDGEHGFLNLLAAVVFGDEEAALAEDDAGVFALNGAAFRWRDQEAGPAELVQARARFHAIGSCSFFEPVEELEALGALPP